MHRFSKYLTTSNQDNTLFKIDLNSNASYLIIPKVNENKAICVLNDKLTVEEIDKENYKEQFYFEDVDTNMFIETKAEYSEDGKYITKTYDSLDNVTTYDINPTNGLLNKLTDAEGNETVFTYNDKEQITSITKGNRTVNYEYNDQNLISKILANDVEYNIVYDDFLNVLEVKVGNQSLSTNIFDFYSKNLLKKKFGNNNEISYVYDDLDRLTKIIMQDDIFNFNYDSLGRLRKIFSNNIKQFYQYDLSNRISRYNFINKNHDEFVVDYDYDTNNNIIEKNYILKNKENSEICKTKHMTYNNDDNVISIDNDNFKLDYECDKLGRIILKKIDNFLVEYKYLSHGNKTSDKIRFIKNNDSQYEYEYDKNSNISKIYFNDKIAYEFDYDEFEQLISIIDYLKNEKYNYFYDSNGNILKEEIINNETNSEIKTVNYFYSNNWNDLLVKIDEEELVYDSIGNPLQIGNLSFKWLNGTNISECTLKDNVNITYTYNKDGIRTSKKVNNVLTNYFLEDNDIIYEVRDGNVLYFVRDEENNLIGLTYDNKKYYFEKNVFGDIIGIYDENNTKIATYIYDSWGKILNILDENGNQITDSTNIAIINPFRYRSYYYDEEIEMYYLNNRLYSPRLKRFINADRLLKNENNNYNLFMYCANNPIKYLDKTGNFITFNLGEKINNERYIKEKSYIPMKIKKNKKIPIFEKLKKIINSLKKSFTFSVGRGYGFSASVKLSKNIEFSVGNYSDETSLIKNGRYLEGTRNVQNISLDIISYSTVDNFINKNCSLTDKLLELCEIDNSGFSSSIKNTSFSKEFIGIEFDFHCYFGGHIKIGFEW